MPHIESLHMENPHYVIAIELDDIVPRRCPSLPNLYLGVSIQPLLERYDSVSATKSDRWFSGHVRCPRPDLCPSDQFPTRESARAAVSAVTKQLSTAGYTVNRNTRVWSVYVVELNTEAIPTPGLGYVYVGETFKPHEQRLLEHLTRARNSKTRLFSPVVAKHGRRLRPDLTPSGVLYSKEASKAAESAWATHLRNLGYVVEGGH